MKKIIYTLLSAGVLFSCGKDEISIEKNLNLDWEVDQKVIEEDIRSRIGYDPNFEYVFLPNGYADIPMISFSTLNIVENNVRDVEAKFLKPLQKDCKLVLEYDASLFEKIKATFPDYELGEASLVKIAEPEKSLTKDATGTTFQVEVANNSSFTKKLLVPFSLKVKEGDKIKVFEENSFFVVKIHPENISLDFPASINIDGQMNYGEAQLSPYVTVKVQSSKPIPTNVKLGLVRDNTLLPEGSTLAPEGMEGDLSEEDWVDFQNKTEAEFRLYLENTEQITEAGTYVLPLKLVMYDENKQAYKVPEEQILLNVRVVEKHNLQSDHSELIDFRWKGVDKNSITSSAKNGTIYGLNRSHDGLSRTSVNIPTGNKNLELTYAFDTSRKIKAIVLRVNAYKNSYYLSSIKSVKVTSIKNSVFESKTQVQGVATFDPEGGNSVLRIIFDKPLEQIDGITLSDFMPTNEKGYIYSLYEIDFYEEE
ncbi:hypothetical protein [Capnocytophaga sp.]|uniref:hypothetical protein n=1 Tax=Capnocytophaga sp. TaxID=44737 RepID=UPI0026DABBE9|nr:hypothetical protein [Capnocytophaga sp.]MDO5105435.1 hypothetical protein [Capnocytophaga sp.]